MDSPQDTIKTPRLSTPQTPEEPLLVSYSHEYSQKNTFMEDRLTPEITDFLNGSFNQVKKKSYASRESLKSPEETGIFLPPSLEDSSPSSKVYNTPSSFLIDKDFENVPTSPPLPVKELGWKSYMGIVFTVISGLMFAVMGLLVKYLKDYNAMNIGFFRFTGMLLPAFPFLLYAIFVQKKPVFQPIWPLNDKSKLKTFLILFVRFLSPNNFFFFVPLLSLNPFLLHSHIGTRCSWMHCSNLPFQINSIYKRCRFHDNRILFSSLCYFRSSSLSRRKMRNHSNSFCNPDHHWGRSYFQTSTAHWRRTIRHRYAGQVST